MAWSGGEGTIFKWGYNFYTQIFQGSLVLKPPFGKFQLETADHSFPDSPSRVTHYPLPVTRYPLPATRYPLPVTRYPLPAPDFSNITRLIFISTKHKQ